MTSLTPYRVPGPPALALDLAGDGSGGLALFMHGIGGNRSNWRRQLPAFAPHFSCAAWDARGYGASDGRIAMRTALLHPDRVATLTLVDTHEGFTAFSPEQRQAFVDSRRAPLLAGKEPRDIADGVARSLVGPHATEEHLQELVASIASLHKASYIQSLQATVDQVDVGDIRAIAAPVHFIVGADDPLTPPTGDALRDGGQARRRSGERAAAGGASQQHRERGWVQRGGVGMVVAAFGAGCCS